MDKYKITYQGIELEIERLPNGKFKIPPLGQFTKQGLGSTWLDDGRIPYQLDDNPTVGGRHGVAGRRIGAGSEGYGFQSLENPEINKSGRFPANLLVSDDVLDDGKVSRAGGSLTGKEPSNPIRNVYGQYGRHAWQSHADTGLFSRYFSLDQWAQRTFPFLVVPKASKAEKNRGCEELYWEKTKTGHFQIDRSRWEELGVEEAKIYKQSGKRISLRAQGNIHPTVKPLKLMAYLIMLGTREGDTVLDPFVGSGATCVAATMLGRKSIAFEIDESDCKIAVKRCQQDIQAMMITDDSP